MRRFLFMTIECSQSVHSIVSFIRSISENIEQRSIAEEPDHLQLGLIVFLQCFHYLPGDFGRNASAVSGEAGLQSMCQYSG